jgi:hypothetical protein
MEAIPLFVPERDSSRVHRYHVETRTSTLVQILPELAWFQGTSEFFLF